jgi:hypothetical protein
MKKGFLYIGICLLVVSVLSSQSDASGNLMTYEQLDQLAQRFRPYLKFADDGGDEPYHPCSWQWLVKRSVVLRNDGNEWQWPPFKSNEELISDPNSLINGPSKNDQCTNMADIRKCPEDQGLALIPQVGIGGVKAGQPFDLGQVDDEDDLKGVKQGAGIYAHVEIVKENPDLLTIEYIILYPWNEGIKDPVCKILANTFNQIYVHSGDMTFVNLVYSLMQDKIIRATFSAHGQVLISYDLMDNTIVWDPPILNMRSIDYVQLKGTSLTGQKDGEIVNAQKVTVNQRYLDPGPPVPNNRNFYDIGTWGNDYVYFVQDPVNTSRFEHIALFIEWGAHEMYPAPVGDALCLANHNGSGTSFLPDKVTFLGTLSDMDQKDVYGQEKYYEHAPFIFFNGTWGNDPRPVIMHREWYYPDHWAVPDGNPYGIPGDRFADKSPYESYTVPVDSGIGDWAWDSTLPWPPEELFKDSFEPNNTSASAFLIGSGFYDNLTIHAPYDEDWYQITVDQDFSDVQISMNYDVLHHDATFYVEYEVCQGGNCSWIQEFAKATPTGRIYETKSAPAARKYRFHVYALDQFPLTYSMSVYVGTGDLPPDPYEPNNSPSTALTFAGKLADANIHNNSDVDYYKINASGYSVETEITFDPTRGNLNLFLDDVQATNFILSADGTEKTVHITGCGNSPSYVRVQGERNFYSISLSKILLQEGCPGYSPQFPLKGSGTFVFHGQQWVPNNPPPEQTATAREDVLIHKTSESPTEVLWTVGPWQLDIAGPGNPYYQLVLQVYCQRTPGTNPVQITAYSNMLNTQWSGSGQGECSTSERSEIITGFSATINLTSPCSVPWCGGPGHGVLTIEGHSAESPIADAGGPYTGTVGSAITFDASGSFDPNGTIALYEWDWNNDGIYEESTKVPKIIHTWNMPYSGPVKLRVTDKDGLTAIDWGDFQSMLLHKLNSTGAYLMISGYRATTSMDISEGTTNPSGWLKFNYRTSAKTCYLSSTSIVSTSMSNATMVIQGTATVNNQPGYTFTAIAIDKGSPGTGLDQFGIEVKDSGGSVFFSAPLTTISGGDLSITAIN